MFLTPFFADRDGDSIKIDTFLIEDIIADMKWSFSRLNSFYTCKRMWYIQYILGIKGENNFFSEYGTHFHEIMEMYDKGQMELFELSDYYKDNFNDKIPHDAPPNKYVNLRDSYYNKGLYYLDNFDGNSDETVGVEKAIEFDLEINDLKVHLMGYIDRLSKDEKGLVITDYKSKSKFTSNDEKEHYLLQLYLYSIGVYNEYGVYPYKLKFNMFKENLVVEEDFDINKIDKAKEWVYNTIMDIYMEKRYVKKTDNIEKDFFCTYLCSCKEKCLEIED